MTERRISLALAVIFLIVGIVAASNTFRLNAYIRETLPRDLRQEQCNTETIDVMKKWVQARADRDDAADSRDEAAVAILDVVLAGGEPTPEQAQAWRDAIINQRDARRDATEHLTPLPDC
jgi:hypothetical protein